MRELFVTLLVFTASLAASLLECQRGEFRCKDDTCIMGNRFCNGMEDCPDGSDEFEDCSPCNRTYFGTIGYTYEMEIKKPTEKQLPFVCYLNFTAAGGSVFGELVQLTFESFTVGTFESFTTAGCPDGFISIKEVNRPSSGGKWCGSAWGYTVYYSETSSVNLTLALDKFMPQQSSSSDYNFDFRISYKFLRLSDARIRYGNTTQRSYRGKLVSGTYCDRLLEGCSKRPCRIQSPNYPGIYPRNISCNYRVRERNVPTGKHALITLRQANFHYKDTTITTAKFEGGESVFRVWDECNMMQDYIEILDGWGPTATTLAHLCSGETIPSIISSGSELLVKFHTSPYGNPFHPLPLSYLPGFELEVDVIYVNKESPTYIEHGKKCEFSVTTFDSTSSGLLENPLHSLPPNTTCHYHFHGHQNSIIWITFIKYHVRIDQLHDLNPTNDDCNVQLQIWDGDIKNADSNVQLIGQFCKDEKPKLCDHSLLTNSSRLTRPCGLTESYLSSKSDLTISHSIRYGSVLYPVNFVLKYEFVDLSQEGVQMTRNPCDRLMKPVDGRFYSPKITFLFGRGGQQDLTCTYQFESTENDRLKFVFNRAHFGNKQCTTAFNPETMRWQCNHHQMNNFAQILVSEYPWPDIELKRDCICTNLTKPFTILTKTASKVLVKFEITNMQITEDYRDYYFDASYEYVANEQQNCLNPWNNRRLRGSSGEITVRSSAQNELEANNQTIVYCLQQPWLIEPENDMNFIYLKVRGDNKRDTRLCPIKNRILVYPAGHTEDVHVICPFYDNNDDFVEMFSEGWTYYIYRKMQTKCARSFVVEYLQKEVGELSITWMEVSKNPALLLPMVKSPECPHSCPELGACISSDLWCDGLRHCPSGSDEQESNCSLKTSVFPIEDLNSLAILVVAGVLLISAIVLAFYMYRHWKRQQKNVIVSVTEHTFLEFKSGLC